MLLSPCPFGPSELKGSMIGSSLAYRLSFSSLARRFRLFRRSLSPLLAPFLCLLFPACVANWVFIRRCETCPPRPLSLSFVFSAPHRCSRPSGDALANPLLRAPPRTLPFRFFSPRELQIFFFFATTFLCDLFDPLIQTFLLYHLRARWRAAPRVIQSSQVDNRGLAPTRGSRLTCRDGRFKSRPFAASLSRPLVLTGLFASPPRDS